MPLGDTAEAIDKNSVSVIELAIKKGLNTQIGFILEFGIIKEEFEK